MFKKTIYIIIVLFIILYNPITINSLSKTTNKSLIVYEIENEFGKLENKVYHLKELLYAFNKEVDIINIADYKVNQVGKYDYVFVVNVINNIENKVFLDDLSNYEKNIYWLGDRVDDYLKYSKKYEIAFERKSDNITSMNYKSKNFFVSDNNLYNIVSSSKSSEMISTISDGYNVYPYIIKENNLYYISSYKIGENYIFEDTLYDFYNIKPQNMNRVFLKIEDVNKEINIENLKEVSKYLYTKHIPFIISITALERDDKNNIIYRIDNNTEVVNLLKDIQKEGGVIILNNGLNKISYEEAEVCVKNELYPLGIDISDIKNSMETNSMYGDISTYIGEYENNKYDNVKSTFPYIIENSDIFRLFIPQNMGHIDEEIFSIDKIKDNFNKISIVRGYTAGICLDVDVNIDKLKEIINFVQDNRLEYLDLKYMKNSIKIGDISISSKDGNISSTYDKKKLHKDNKEEQKQYKFFRSINDTVILFVIIVLIIFLIIFIIFRKINKDKFTR